MNCLKKPGRKMSKYQQYKIIRNDSSQSNEISSQKNEKEKNGPETDGGCAVTVVTFNHGAATEVVFNSDVEKGSRCGWFGYSCGFVQIFNNPKGYLLLFCVMTLLQSMIAFGLVFISLTALEKRFKLTSFQSGFIPSTYEISCLAVTLIVTYFGERGHKPRWIGIGSAIFSLGSVVFALPHFLTDIYEPVRAQPYMDLSEDLALCQWQPENTTGSLDCDVGAGNGSVHDVSFIYWIFIVAQILHGIGGSTLYTVGVTYLDENVEAKNFGVYFGFFNAAIAVGPTVGYALGGVFLNIYTDFDVTDSGLMTPDSPMWVGAWWLGFLVSGGLLFTTSLLMAGFPKALPGSEEIARNREAEVQRGQEFESGHGWRKRLETLPQALRNLLTNIPFMCICFFTACQFFSLAVGVFGPKYLETQFNISSSEAAYTGMLTMFGLVIGAFVGGAIIKKFDLKFKGIVRVSILVNIGAILACCCFMLKCPNTPTAGVTVPYHNSSLASGSNLTAACNSDCNCGTNFDPVCGSDGILYYSPCHAGCKDQSDGDEISYIDCSCIGNGTDTDFSTVPIGKCSPPCSSFIPFCVMSFILLFFDGMVMTLMWAATIRCVDHSQRTFALGLETVIYSVIGLVPGPVIVGLLIDKTCLLWEESCDGFSTCWQYSNSDLSKTFFIIVLLSNVTGVIFLTGSLFSYKVPEGKKGGDEKNAFET